jgi:hypothetical protein
MQRIATTTAVKLLDHFPILAGSIAVVFTFLDFVKKAVARVEPHNGFFRE